MSIASTATEPADLDYTTPGPALAHLGSMPRVDLMPLELAERDALRRLQGGCAVVLVASAAIVGLLYYQAHSSIAKQRTNLASAQAQQASTQGQVSQLAYVTAQYAAVEQAQGLVSQALSGEVRWSSQLRDLSLSIPSNVWLTNMTVAPGATAAATTPTATATAPTGIATITYTGYALRRDDVARWLESLAKQKGYVDAYYTSSQQSTLSGQSVYNFTSTVTVTADALSGRYTTANGG